MSQRELIIIGLGGFGAKVLDVLETLLEDRRAQLPEDLGSSVVIHKIPFAADSVFSFTDLSSKLALLVKDSQARKFGRPFSYLIVGDLGEEMVARYALDYAYLPWVLDQSKTLSRESVLGYFTFADELGVNARHTESGMALIREFFSSIEKTSLSGQYIAPFTDVNEKSFFPVSAPHGPFERNYVVVTPGGREAVLEETSRVFAERIFYEAFYLSGQHSEKESNIQAARFSKSDFLFSTFSLVQVTRVKQLQEYYLRYNLQYQVLSYLLAKKITGTDLSYFEEKFFEILDMDPHDESFPLDRAAELFFQQNKPRFKGILDYRIGTEDGAYLDYLADCKKRIDSVVQDLRPKYDQFIKDEINSLLFVIEQAITSLFRIDRLTGNINTYISYVEMLEKRLTGWIDSLEHEASEQSECDISQYFEKAEERIKKVLQNKALNFVLFKPVRQSILRKVILNIPVELYLRDVVRGKLSQGFRDQWREIGPDSRHPIPTCVRIRTQLEALKGSLISKQEQVFEKIKFIEQVNSFYYVISQLESSEYKLLLKRIYERNFGSVKKSQLEATAVNAFKTWTSEKDVVGIIGDPSRFVEHVEKFSDGCKEHYGDCEDDAESASKFACDAVSEMRSRMESLSLKSFRVQNQSNYISESRFLLKPDLSRPDSLELKLDEDSLLFVKKVPRDFTQGSAVFFQDYIHLPFAGFQKFEALEKYKDSSVPAPKYAGLQTEHSRTEVSDETMTVAAKHIRSILLDVCTPALRKILFERIFGEEKNTLSELDVNRLSMHVELKTVLEVLDDTQLRNYARENDIPLTSNREKLIANVVKTIME